MGNEEHDASVERYLDHAGRWNAEITTPSYVHDRGPVVMVHASPDFGRDFDDDGTDWIIAQVRAAAPRPVFLVVHAAQAGVYPENAEKGVHHSRFADVVSEPNLVAVRSAWTLIGPATPNRSRATPTPSRSRGTGGTAAAILDLAPRVPYTPPEPGSAPGGASCPVPPAATSPGPPR